MGLKIKTFKAEKPLGSFHFDVEGWLKKDISFFSRKSITDKFKESLYIELSTLIGAGLDFRGAMDIVSKQQKDKRCKAVCEAIMKNLVNGCYISESFQKTERFSLYEFYSLKIGEESGKTTDVLRELSMFYSKRIKQRRQVIQALTYPSIVVLSAIGAVVFMLNFVVPMFSEIFLRFGGDLPYLTKLIIAASRIFSQYFMVMVLTMAVIGMIFFWSRKKIWYKRYYAIMIRKIPFAGDLIKKIYLTRLCSAFALLTAAKVPLLQSISMVRKMIDYFPVDESLKEVEKDIVQGKLLHQSLSRFDFYDVKLITFVKIGEEVNKLDFFFDKLAHQYSEEVEYKSLILSQALEPFIIIFLGLVVGLILIGMYLPIFQLSTTIG